MARVDRDVALYLSGFNEQERAALACALYEYREINDNGDDTEQIQTYKNAIEKIIAGEGKFGRGKRS